MNTFLSYYDPTLQALAANPLPYKSLQFNNHESLVTLTSQTQHCLLTFWTSLNFPTLHHPTSHPPPFIICFGVFYFFFICLCFVLYTKTTMITFHYKSSRFLSLPLKFMLCSWMEHELWGPPSATFIGKKTVNKWKVDWRQPVTSLSGYGFGFGLRFGQGVGFTTVRKLSPQHSWQT